MSSGSQQSNGVLAVIAAERRAKEKLAEARARRKRRLKQAVQEATFEIDGYKQHCEAIYRQQLHLLTGRKADIDKETLEKEAREVSEINRLGQLHRREAAERLFAAVVDVTPQLHANYDVVYCRGGVAGGVSRTN